MTDETRPLKRGPFVSVRLLLLALFTALFTVVLALTFYGFYTTATEQALRQVQEDLLQALETTSLQVNAEDVVGLSEEGQPNAAGIAWQAAQYGGDAERQAALAQYGPPNQAGFSDDPRYRRLLDWADAVHRIEPRAWPYVWINAEAEDEIVYVMDLGARYDPAKSTLFLEAVTDAPHITELEFSVDELGKLASYEDEWGRWYSAWQPIADGSGNPIGGIGIDFEAGEVEQVQQEIRNQVVIAFALTYLALFVVVFMIARYIARPVAALTKAAGLIGEGQYDQDFSSLVRTRFFHSEINVLAEVFGAMVDKVYQREQSLVRKVEELRIEIDVVKRQKQVSEIVESDFFVDLQQRARQMRRRQTKGGAADGGAQ